MVGRVTPGFEINDNPGTTGRSVGYGADFTSWVQDGPDTLKLHNLPSASRASPGFAEGRMVGYGADLPAGITSKYPQFLQRQLDLPVIGMISLGTLAIGLLVGILIVRKK